ncbi:uncharacterized protein LOC127103830 [Lathyrus oleraceus]|uniref:uncharacterized protein LOC127103830 n=1 Tax=Pisum sativum TaxID=3888 RepID=UPI0021CF3184|nr:uncharacterized protein LOC127103830 [Pisum sativum]
METSVAAQNQLPPELVQRAIILEVMSTPIYVAPMNASRYQIHPNLPWGMPPNYILEGYHPQVPEAPVMPVVMLIPPSVIHTTPYHKEPIFHATPSESMGSYEKMDEFQDQFVEIQREIKALREKDLFEKNAHDLCLVPNVKIPAKFRVPDFEKYKGDSCLRSHLIMYARKMSTQTDNHRLLIHYFQHSLTGAALKWYMNLDIAYIHTFSDLSEAFIRQYKYNIDMAPDRDKLRAMSQRDKETFKEYAQIWRGVAAQICPSPEESKMSKIYLKTLSTFYYERMIVSAPSDFTDMVNMGMHLEEGVCEG